MVKDLWDNIRLWFNFYRKIANTRKQNGPFFCCPFIESGSKTSFFFKSGRSGEHNCQEYFNPHKQLAWTFSIIAAPSQMALLLNAVLKRFHSLCAYEANRNDESKAPLIDNQVQATLCDEGIKIAAIFRRIAANLIFIFNLAILYIRRISDDDIESASFVDPIELGEPVKGLVGFPPLFEGVLIFLLVRDTTFVDSIFAGEEVVELIS